MKRPSKVARLLLGATLIAAVLATSSTFSRDISRASAQGEEPAFRDTGITLEGNDSFCFDMTHPNSVVHTEADKSVVSIDWNTGKRTTLAGKDGVLACSGDGTLYSTSSDGTSYVTSRYDASDGQWHKLKYTATEIAQDGTGQIYAITDLPTIDNPNSKSRLMYSSDRGVTWQERALSFKGALEDIAAARQYAGVVYAAVTTPGTMDYTIYFSPDAGVTWQSRGKGTLVGRWYDNRPSIEVETIDGDNASVDVIEVVLDRAVMGSSNQWHKLISTDGGYTFNEAGLNSLTSRVQLAYTNNGIIRLENQGNTNKLSRSGDGGKNWQDISPWPQDYQFGSWFSVGMQVADAAPVNLFVYSDDTLWYSFDGGGYWTTVVCPASCDLAVTPYLPLSVVTRGYVLDLPDAGKTTTWAVGDSKVPGGMYWREPGHNLLGVFKNYWQDHGGLAQFGLPRTEAFTEISTNGRAYKVQYFERAKFEWHPENRGTTNEVLLGLLGAQLTKERRDAHEGAFNAIADPGEAGRTFYPQTGHTLRNAFKRYWEAHGGLALYGYPLSEEFYEVNEQNGKTYVVQYFERNRFEWHPENEGGPYEVLLGALGNELLKLKGWN